jgi:hypothetical protein
MSTLDLSPIVQPILAVIGAVITGLLAIYVPKALAAFQARTGIMLTAQQSAAILGFVQTSKGIVETKLDQGALQVAHVNVSNPTILAEAQSILAAAPVAAAGLGMTEAGVPKMIVGAVDTGSHGAVAVADPAPSPAIASLMPVAPVTTP